MAVHSHNQINQNLDYRRALFVEWWRHISACAISVHYDGWLGGRVGGSVAEWLACRTQARKITGSNRSRDTVE